MKTAEMSEKAVFVKLSDYKEIVELMNSLHSRIQHSRELLAKLQELKKEEDEELSLWENTVSGITKKLNNIESTLFEPEMRG